MQQKQAMRGGCSSIALPTAARFSEESRSLADKLAKQVQWMKQRGIDIRLKETERPSVEKKLPLPGTVLHFPAPAESRRSIDPVPVSRAGP